jgi:hypothetical protein
LRVARILAILLALLALGISGYFAWRSPLSSWYLIPAGFGSLLMLFVWRSAPSKKKGRRRAAAYTALYVPFLMASAVLSLFISPISTWPVYLALSTLAFMLAIFAAMRINRKSVHPWQDYYPESFT